MENTAATSLYDLLVTKDFEPKILDSSGRDVSDPKNAEMFSFEFQYDGKDYGTVVALFGKNNELEIFYGDSLGRSLEGDARNEWYRFLAHMKDFAVRNMLKFELSDIGRLKYTMQGIAAIKEGLFEGYHGRRNISYNRAPTETRIMIRHNRDLAEGEPRHRAIESIYIETAGGERFRVPTRSLTHARMLERHVCEGGNPYDIFGQHISSTVKDMGTLGRFLRATRGREFTGGTKPLVDAAVKHYGDLKDKAKRMISHRGYYEERDQFDPAEILERDHDVNHIREMFIERNIDNRIEDALPILSRLANGTTENDMKEIKEFENWATGIVEGTWALPDTPDAQQQLQNLLSAPLIVGADAANATEKLYDLIGDDILFDRLHDLADRDPNANCWEDPEIINRLGELGIDINPTVGPDSGEQGVTEGSNPEKVEVRISGKAYNAMTPAQKAAKQKEWQQLKQQAKMRMQNFTLIDTDKERDPNIDDQGRLRKPGEELSEIGNTPAGRAALGAVQNRAYNKMDAWSANPTSGYSSTPKDVQKATSAGVAAGNRLHGFGPDNSRENTVMARDALRQKYKEKYGVVEGYGDNAVASALTRRIMSQRLDLLKKYGPVKVTQAIDDAAEFFGDVEEIGTSDMYAYMQYVEKALGNMNEQGLAEGTSRGIMLNGKEVDMRSLEIENVDARDYPDFSDAYIGRASFTDGTDLNDQEMDQLNDEHGDLVHELAYDSLHESDLGEDLDTDGVMMTKPSNMSSESVDPVLRLKQMLKY